MHLMIDAKADLEIQDEHGCSALMYACVGNQQPLIEVGFRNAPVSVVRLLQTPLRWKSEERGVEPRLLVARASQSGEIIRCEVELQYSDCRYSPGLRLEMRAPLLLPSLSLLTYTLTT